MINLKKLLTSINTAIHDKVNRSGDTMSGELKVVIPDGSNHAKMYTECHGTDGNLVSAGALESSLSGNVGLYDYKHGRWVCRNDADGRPHVPANLAVLNTAKVACSSIGTSFKYQTVSGLNNWNLVAIHFTVNEASQVIICLRGESYERYIIDAPSAGRFRGGIMVDWGNNRIGMRCINAPSGKQNLVYFDYVYGVL